MSLDLLDTNLSGPSNGDFILRRTIADKLEVHLGFREFPEHVPGPARLRELTEQFKKAVDAAANHELQMVAEKKAIRAETEQAQSITAYHVVMVSIYKKDPNVLLNTGWELKRRTAWGKNASSGNLAAPSTFKVKHGTVSGTVIATVNRAQGTASTELQMTEGDPSVESLWSSLGRFSQRRIKAKSLELTKRIHFRARFHRAGAVGPWSPIVSLIII